MAAAEQGAGYIFISTISIVEVTYLVEKSRVSASSLEKLLTALREDRSRLRDIQLSFSIAKVLALVPRQKVPDLPDRIIAATALALGVPLVTADRQIRASGIETIW
jgi:predicted nucleic acid-binding protein